MPFFYLFSIVLRFLIKAISQRLNEVDQIEKAKIQNEQISNNNKIDNNSFASGRSLDMKIQKPNNFQIRANFFKKRGINYVENDLKLLKKKDSDGLEEEINLEKEHKNELKIIDQVIKNLD